MKYQSKILLKICNASFLITILFLFSCSEGTESTTGVIESQLNLSPPRITIIADLPDSLQPKTTLLADVPKPTYSLIPTKAEGSYAVRRGPNPEDVWNIPIEPPSRQMLPVLRDDNGRAILGEDGKPFILGSGGYSHFTHYSTEDGLGLDNINCSILDIRGHIWFGTDGGGVSRYDGRSFHTFTTVHGLADNWVTSIIEDSNGDLWFGTLSGVSRYDGRTFTNYTPEQGLGEGRVTAFIEDKEGMLWVGIYGGGISRFDPESADGKGESFTTYDITQGLLQNSVRSFFEDQQGIFWIGTEAGLSRFDRKEFTNFTAKDGLPSRRVWSIIQDQNGKIWLGAWNGGGLCWFDPTTANPVFNTYTRSQGLAGNSVREIIEDSQGIFWVGTNGGLSHFDPTSISLNKKVIFTSFTIGQGLVANGISSITEDRKGKFWFGTPGSGVSRFDPSGDNKKGNFTKFSSAQGMANNKVFSIAEDKLGNIWFGTVGDGISRFNGSGFTTLTPSQYLSNPFVVSVISANNGDLWMSNWGTGVTLYDGRRLTNYTSRQGLVRNTITSIGEDQKGNFWFGGVGNASRFDGHGFTTFTSDHGLPEGRISDILSDRMGNIWFSSGGWQDNGSGVSYYQPPKDGQEEKFIKYTTAQGLASDKVYCITEDQKGNLWFGTQEGLTFLSVHDLPMLQTDSFDANHQLFKNFTTDAGLPNNTITQVVSMPNGKIAVGTIHGIAVFDGPEDSTNANHFLSNLEVFNSSNGYPIKNVNFWQNSMIADHNNSLWIATDNDHTATVRFDYASFQKNEVPLTLSLYGIRINEENICWYNLDREYSSTMEGDSLTIPTYITEEASTFGRTLSELERENFRQKYAGIAFDGISSFYPIPQNLSLPYLHNNIGFDFGADELAHPYLVEYQYFLEGYDRDWSPIVKKTSASFGNIVEGTYTFKLKARFTGPSAGGSNQWTEPLTYTFKVLPPWYRTWWSYLVYILIVVTSIYLFIRLRTQKLMKEKLLLEKKVSDRTVELKASLDNLKSTQSQLIQSEKMASLGELTAGIAHEIQNPLNFVNNFSEVSNELIDEMNEEIDKGDLEEVKAISSDIKQNLAKINHHGNRASSIVKGMLDHSRTSSGEKVLTDINQLADEYLRLSYHGLRAKDKSFNGEYELNLDENLPHLNVVPQDIGRLLLNLINNAFYAVNEKNKEAVKDYQPKITISTMPKGNQIEISVSDNGNGIPKAAIEKIFQPFFTTKPTGKGTGLGLSLSYDIVKAHGGELKVNSEEGKRTEFLVVLPLDSRK